MKRLIGTLALAMTLAATSFAEEKLKDGREVDIPKSKLPANIAKAVQEAIPEGKIADIDRDINGGKITWDIGVELKGKTYAVEVDQDGKVLSKVEVVSESLKVADLPAAIADSVKKEFPGGHVTRAEKLTKGTVVTYEMDVDVARKTYEIVMTAEGKLKSKAEMSEDAGKK